MESKHTPGPWTVNKRNGRLVMAGEIKVATAERYAAEQPMAWHNAKLIAAAPEMLELLSGLLDSFEAYTALNKPEAEWDEYDHMMHPRWKAANELVKSLTCEQS